MKNKCPMCGKKRHKIIVTYVCWQCDKMCERTETQYPEEVEIIAGYDDRNDCNFYFEPLEAK